MKVTIWQISGYRGFYDYDGSCDDNMSFQVAMDSRFTQKGVEDIFFRHYSSKYRVVALKAVKMCDKIID